MDNTERIFLLLDPIIKPKKFKTAKNTGISIKNESLSESDREESQTNSSSEVLIINVRMGFGF